MSLPELVIRYSTFAVVATLVNLASQRVVLNLLPGHYGFALAVLVGTAAGLIVKYVLDKKWIFFDRSSGAATHGRKFGLYTAMGIVTTAIFWGSETLFWLTWQTELMRELGAVIGLAIGYIVKYNLDRRFVFRDAILARG